MPDWFLPYTAAALVAAAIGWLAFNYDPDADRTTAAPASAGTPAAGQPVAQQAPGPAPANGGNPPAAAPEPAPSAPAPATSPGETAIRNLVTEAMTTDRASDCTRLYTQAFLEQIAGEVGSEAVEDCRDNSDGSEAADSVDFKSLTRSGGDYRVVVDLIGGELDASVFALMAVRSGGVWKIDRLLAVDIDMEAQAQVAREGLSAEGYSAADADCAAQQILAADEAAYERAVLEGRASEYAKTILDQAVSCLSVEALRRELADGIRAGAGSDAPEALIECVIDEIVGGRSAAELRTLIQMDSSAGYELGRQAAAACAQRFSAVS